MPALTHNRVKNGFNGGRRLKQARNSCPKAPNIPNSGCGAGDASRRNALIGGIGSRNASNRAAIQRQVCKPNCQIKQQEQQQQPQQQR